MLCKPPTAKWCQVSHRSPVGVVLEGRGALTRASRTDLIRPLGSDLFVRPRIRRSIPVVPYNAARNAWQLLYMFRMKTWCVDNKIDLDWWASEQQREMQIYCSCRAREVWWIGILMDMVCVAETNRWRRREVLKIWFMGMFTTKKRPNWFHNWKWKSSWHILG